MSNICPTTGTYSREHLLRCLARSVNKRPTLSRRREFLKQFGKRHPKHVVDKLKQYMQEEWQSIS